MSTEDTTVVEGTVSTPSTEGVTPATTEGVANATEESTSTTETTEGTGVTEATDTESTSEESEQTSTDDSGEADFYFNGQQVQVEIPEDLKGNLDAAGVNVDSVIKELYGKDSDFTLSDETRAPLDEKYGKVVVDTFLNAMKSQNEGILKGATEAQNAASEADKQAVEWSNEVVGGEDNWNSLESWATENLDEGEITSFNKAMSSGDKWMQELAIKALNGKMQSAEGDTTVSLVSGDSSGETGSGAGLSGQDYINEMTSTAFRGLKGHDKINAQKQLDARRRTGMKRGL